MKVSNRIPKIVILSGAGLSADSGIKTYRGEGGQYDGFRTEQIMNHGTLIKTPKVIHRFCDDRRVELGKAEPNAAHHMIKGLADKYGNQVIHLTQNIDDLMERAGHERTYHLHGELRVMRSPKANKVQVDIGFTRYWDGDTAHMSEFGFQFRCPMTGYLLRPAVVLFKEPAPLYLTLRQVFRNLRRDDIVIVIGTQGSVVNVNDLISGAPCKAILNNLHDSDDIEHKMFDQYLKMTAVEAAPLIEETVDNHMARFRTQIALRRAGDKVKTILGIGE